MIDIKKLEQMAKEQPEQAVESKRNIFLEALDARSEGKSNKEIASIFVEEFYKRQVKDGKVETSALYVGTLTFVEGEDSTMLLGANNENNVDEKCILYPVIMTPHSGTIFLDIINETLLETQYGFLSFGNMKKSGVLVESGQPLNELMNQEVAEIDEIKAFINEVNKPKQKTREF